MGRELGRSVFGAAAEMALTRPSSGEVRRITRRARIDSRRAAVAASRVPRRARVLVALVVAGLMGMLAQSLVFSGTAWASGNGYGPGGPPGGGEGGGFIHLIAVKTIGPAGGTIVAGYHGSQIEVSIPPDLLPKDEFVVVAPLEPMCGLRNGQVVLGMSVFVVDDHGMEGFFSKDSGQSLQGAQVTVSNPRVTTGSRVLDAQSCSALTGVEITDGQVVITVGEVTSFLITAPPPRGGPPPSCSPRDDQHQGCGGANQGGDRTVSRHFDSWLRHVWRPWI